VVLSRHQTAAAAGKTGRYQYAAPSAPRRAYNEATAMKTLNHNSVECFSMEEGTSDAPLPPRKQSNVRQLAPGYLWNGATQELIPILPEGHPDYRENAETIRAAFHRWERVTSK
jgi:hypothetical protein